MNAGRIASFVVCLVLIAIGLCLTWYGNALPQDVHGYMTAVGVSEPTTTNIFHVVGPVLMAVGAALLMILVFVRREKNTQNLSLNLDEA